MIRKIFCLLLLSNVCLGYTITHTDYTSNGTITASGQNANENTIVNLVNGNLDSTNIAAGAIGTTQLAAQAVTAAKIQTGTITATQLNNAAATGSTSNTAGLAGQGVIAQGTVSTPDLRAGACMGNIQTSTITASLIANNTITATQIANGTILTNQIGVNTLTGSSSNTGGAGNIAQGTISNPDLRANAVTLSSATANVGGISIQGTTITSVPLTTIGGRVLLTASGVLHCSNAANVAALIDIDDGTTVFSADNVTCNATNSINGVFSLTALVLPSAGAHTYSLNWQNTANTSILSYNLVAIELRD